MKGNRERERVHKCPQKHWHRTNFPAIFVALYVKTRSNFWPIFFSFLFNIDNEEKIYWCGGRPFRRLWLDICITCKKFVLDILPRSPLMCPIVQVITDSMSWLKWKMDLIPERGLKQGCLHGDLNLYLSQHSGSIRLSGRFDTAAETVVLNPSTKQAHLIYNLLLWKFIIATNLSLWFMLNS